MTDKKKPQLAKTLWALLLSPIPFAVIGSTLSRRLGSENLTDRHLYITTFVSLALAMLVVEIVVSIRRNSKKKREARQMRGGELWQ